MNNLKKYQRFFYIFLGICAFLLLVSAFLRVITPTPTTVPATDLVTVNKDGSISQFNGLRFTGTTPNLPKELPIARVEFNTVFARNLAEYFIETYRLEQNTEIQSLWQSSTYSLNETRDGRITLMNENFAIEATGTVNREAAIAKAREFIATTIPEANLQLIESDISVGGGYQEANPDPDAESGASQILLPFGYLLEGIPIYIEQHLTPPFIIIFDAGLGFKRVDFQNYFIFVAPDKKAPLLSVDQALQKANDDNLGSVLSATHNGPAFVSLSEIESGELTDVRLEYRADRATNLAYPVYRFFGTVTNSAGTLMDVQIITPAVATES